MTLDEYRRLMAPEGLPPIAGEDLAPGDYLRFGADGKIYVDHAEMRRQRGRRSIVAASVPPKTDLGALETDR